MATLPQLEMALKNAHKAGDVDAARKLAVVVKRERAKRSEDPSAGYLENFDFEEPQVEGGQPPQPEPGVAETALGTGEAALSTATGATGGTIGMLGGTLYGLANELLSGEFGTNEAAQRIQQEAMRGAQRFTYEPRTQSGKEQLQAVGEVGEALIPLAPFGQELGMMAKSAASAIPAARVGATAARQGVQTAAQKAQPVIKQAAQRVRESLPGQKPETFGAETAGAAKVGDRGALNLEMAKEEGFGLLKGQKTGAYEDIKFEREIAKMPEEGAPIREAFAKQREHADLKLDEWIESTGAEMTELGPVGEFVTEVLKNRKEKDRAKVKSLYKAARKSEEGKRKAPADREIEIEYDGDVERTSIVKFLNNALEGVETSRFTDAMKKYGVKLGVLRQKDDGTYEANPAATVNDLEDFRMQIQERMPAVPSKGELRDATVLKKIIDKTTEPVAGPLFQRARKADEKMHQDYIQNALTNRLLETKRGTNDRQIAVENVLDKVILSPATSLEQMRHVKRLLQTKTGGKQGQGVQAWKELQAATLRHIKDKMQRLQQDEQGNQTLSASGLNKIVTQLDRNGKLDFIFGKAGAERIKLVNEIVKTIENAPPGAVNYSNTATVLAGFIDMSISGTAGAPAPILSGFNMILNQVKDARLKAKIKEHLKDAL